MENEELVKETENVEETTEEIATESEGIEEAAPVEETVEEPKEETFTKKQVDEMLAKKLARKEAKMRKEYAKKYGNLENVVNAGLGTESTEEAVEKLTQFYTQKGINIPKYNVDEDTETKAAKFEAREIIEAGYDDIVDEVDNMAQIGIENMTLGDKVKFKMLADERKRIEEQRELASIGVSELDDDFRAFEKKLNPELSLKEKYELYQETKPKKEIKTMGSMKNTPSASPIKEYYTRDEALRLSDDDYKKHPELYEIIEKSMLKW